MAPINKPTGRQLDAALTRMGALSDAGMVRDEQLNELLEPFRGHAPTKLRCSRTGCRGTVVWCALHPVLAQVVFSSHGPRKGHVENIEKAGAAPWVRNQPPPPFNYWSLGPSGGRDAAKPSQLASGETVRWTFNCRKCKTPHTLTNRKIIVLIAKALTGNQREVQL